MNFITVFEDIITGVYCGDISSRFNLCDGHTKHLIPPDSDVLCGEPVSYYNEDWKRKPDVQLMKEGFMQIPEGYTISEDILTEIQKYQYILNGELSSGYFMPQEAELYYEDEWYFNGDKYLKKDESYNIWLKKQEILQELTYVDASVTARTLREATLGDPLAIEIIRCAEERAQELRKKLSELA